MDNKQYINKLSRRATLDYKETQQLVNSAVGLISDLLCNGDTIAIPAFGSFAAGKVDEHIETDDSTGQRILMPPSIKVEFTPGTILTKRTLQR